MTLSFLNERTCSNCSFFESDESACSNIASIVLPQELIDADFCCPDHESAEIGAARTAARAAVNKARRAAK